MDNIYQQIWNSDRHKFSVSSRDGTGWLDPNADILLDEQVKAFGRKDLDLARNPLFYRLNSEKLETIPTYVSLIALLNNYRFDNQKSEVVTRGEKAEVTEFIDLICQTEPMYLTEQYLRDRLQIEFSHGSFEQTLIGIWFDLYTNYYGDISLRDSSGFEHIFVGEGKYSRTGNSKRSNGAISGYHSWLKFYLDEQQHKVNYLGHNYTIDGNIGSQNPFVVSVQMRWQEKAPDNLTEEFFKKRGGFFVGTSPECEIALGTVAYFESLNNLFVNEKKRITINDANYELHLYRNLEPDGRRGNFIRSFYPVYLGNENFSQANSAD